MSTIEISLRLRPLAAATLESSRHSVTPAIKINLHLYPLAAATVESSRHPIKNQVIMELVPLLKGDPGAAANLSADPSNVATVDSDGRLYVPPPSVEWASNNW